MTIRIILSFDNYWSYSSKTANTGLTTISYVGYVMLFAVLLSNRACTNWCINQSLALSCTLSSSLLDSVPFELTMAPCDMVTLLGFGLKTLLSV